MSTAPQPAQSTHPIGDLDQAIARLMPSFLYLCVPASSAVGATTIVRVPDPAARVEPPVQRFLVDPRFGSGPG